MAEQFGIFPFNFDDHSHPLFKSGCSFKKLRNSVAHHLDTILPLLREGGELSVFSSWEQLLKANKEVFRFPTTCKTSRECFQFIIYEAIRINLCDGCVYDFIYLPLAENKGEKNLPISSEKFQKLLEITAQKIIGSKIMKDVIIASIIDDFLTKMKI